MKIDVSYNAWAKSYDSQENKTRDLEALVLRESFLNPHYGNILELGCGTGKNTGWLSTKADHVTALDFSSEMISKARAKVEAENVTFSQTDINKPWPVRPGWSNLITCSLVLEHIEDLDFIFKEAARVIKRKGKFYICELHPLKQYSGSQARFETPEGIHKLEVFVHHISDYLGAAKTHGFNLLDLKEYFDDKENDNLPRLLSLILESEK